MAGRAKAAAPRKKANGYKMPAPIPVGEVIHDTIGKKRWRIGPSIGVGGFGEIYSACDDQTSPKKGANKYPFVVKIEPHENGPLFVEKHFYVRNASENDIRNFMKSKNLSTLGMPTYFGNGSHEYKGEKYRYLVLERYGKDIWTIFKDCKRSFPCVTVFQLGLQMLDVLEYIHNKGYVHADIKGANILLGLRKGTENQAYLVDFGLASRVNDKEFKPDPKCAHNGTIEYTSRDAHLGVPTMRGDLEILGYNMLQWLVGELPWEKSLQQPKTVQNLKESFMNNVRTNITKQFKSIPDGLIKFFEYINTLKPKQIPDYTKCKQLFEKYLKGEGKTRNSKLEFTPSKQTKTAPKAVQDDEDYSEGDEIPLKPKRGRRAKVVIESDGENEEPEVLPKANGKRLSSEPPVVKTKRVKTTPKATPPAKKNHANIATQTSIERPRRSNRAVTSKPHKEVSFDSPICEIIGEKKPLRNESVNSSGDIFEDSFEVEEKKLKPKRKVISEEVITVERVIKKKVSGRAKSKATKEVAVDK